jgi:hypothetical protein
MAAATLEQLEQRDARGVLWAHNCHVAYDGFRQYGKTSQGGWLRGELGSGYRSVGFAFARGGVRAWGDRELQAFMLDAAVPGSLDHALALAAPGPYAIDLRTPAPDDVDAWLRAGPYTRSIGHSWLGDDHPWCYERQDPREQFDWLIFVDEVSASRPNPAGARPARQPAPAVLPQLTNGRMQGGEQAPEGWTLIDPSAVGRYRARASSDAVVIDREPVDWDWGLGRLEQRIDAQALRGRTVRYEQAGADLADGARAYAYVCIETEDDYTAHDLRLPVSATQLSVLVPADARQVVLGLALAGNGTAALSSPSWVVQEEEVRDAAATSSPAAGLS